MTMIIIKKRLPSACLTSRRPDLTSQDKEHPLTQGREQRIEFYSAVPGPLTFRFHEP